MSEQLGEVSAIAEDLGVITPAVERLRDRLGLPGTVVTQFILDWHKSPIHVAENSVAYTATHDNDTSLGWWQQTHDHIRHHAWHVAAEAGITTKSRAGS